MIAIGAHNVTQKHSVSIRVYWEDTDAGGVVFYANYLKYFERARTEWLRALGIEQRLLQQSAGIQFVVADVQLRYLAPARLDDVLQVSARLVEWGNASLVFEQEARCGDVLLTRGTVRAGCVSATTMRPQRIPAALREILQRG